jgi:hypothetical protein
LNISRRSPRTSWLGTIDGIFELVKAHAERIGLKAADFGTHSPRAGFLTRAARRAASVPHFCAEHARLAAHNRERPHAVAVLGGVVERHRLRQDR